MYDILQLNDMLVPELLDIAEQQNIPDTKNLQKQELNYKILDKQASMTSNDKKETTTEKPKRKRIVKPTAKKQTEETTPTTEEKESKSKKTEDKKKPAPKKQKEEEAETPELDFDQYIDDEDDHVERLADPKTIAPALIELLKDEDEEVEEMMQEIPANVNQGGKSYQKKEPAFNIEFDGVILAEGVLEMMPDGYGFLRSSD